jgi:hypothetical protein
MYASHVYIATIDVLFLNRFSIASKEEEYHLKILKDALKMFAQINLKKMALITADSLTFSSHGNIGPTRDDSYTGFVGNLIAPYIR